MGLGWLKGSTVGKRGHRMESNGLVMEDEVRWVNGGEWGQAGQC